MDPGPCGLPGLSGLESSLPHSDPPCLIVEDSQPDSIGIEDDPETSYRALLSKRLSTLQPPAPSPVLELISSPVGSRSSQSVGQSQPQIPDAEMDPSFEESEILDVSDKKCPSEDLDSRGQSQSHNDGTSQFGFLELSQSQDFGSEPVHQNQTRTKTDETRTSPRPQSRPSPQVSVDVLLHSQNQDRDQDQDQEEEMLSTQEDLFDKPGAVPDPVLLSSTPSRSLALLHLSGAAQGGTLVQDSPSQGSVDFVAPTPDLTPMMVPSSPTELQPHGDEPMDTSLPPAADQSGCRDTGPAPKLPSSSTPVSQSSPGFELERPLSVPSQPDFSHDVFAPTQSQEVSRSSPHAKPPLASASAAPSHFSETSAVSLNLSVNTELQDEDEEATQIEHLDHDNAVPEKPASHSQNSQKIQPSADGEVRRSPGLNSSQADSLQSVAKTLNAGSQNSIRMMSQEAKTQPETSKQGPNANANSQKCEMLNVNSDKTVNKSSQGSANANSQPAGSVQEVLVGSQTKVMNVDQEKTAEKLSQGSAKANTQPTGSAEDMVSDEKAVKVGSQTKTLNVDSEKTAEKLSQGSAKANAQSAGSIEEIVLGSQTKTSNVHNTSTEKSQNGEEEAEKEVSLGLALSQSEITMSGHREEEEEEGGKMSADGKGAKGEVGGVRSLDSSGDISFHFTLPKEGELIGPSVGATPPQLSQLKQSLRHSTPIEVNSLSQNSDVSAHSDIVAEGSDVTAERPDGKLSLRMKLVTPVEEGSSERFSLQRPALSDEDPAGSKTTAKTGSKTVPSGASVFSRVRQVHRAEPEENSLLRSPVLASPQRNSAGCNSLPHSQSDSSVQEVTSQPRSSAAANENRARNPSQNAPRVAGSHDKTDPETPPPRRPGPAHRRHVRTIQEVRTTVTRIITDVYYEDGREVDRTVTQETDEPVVQYQAMDVSPSRTGSSSVTSGDLADISSSTCTTGTGSTSTERSEFLPPPSRGTKANRAPPAGPVQDSVSQVLASDSARSSPDLQPSSGSSFVGLRVVAKWSSNGYFYSGRIIEDCGVQAGLGGSGSESGSGSGPGENRFRLRFDDGYECELWARDILLCDPIPTETEVTALNQDQTYCTGVVRGHKVEGQDLLYCVERGDQRQWFSRSSVILSLDQGNKLRERHCLGPYEPPTVLSKASDISLDNLVEGKRKRRGAQSGLNTPSRSVSSPRPKPGPGPSPGPSPGSKRKLGSERTPAAKRGRRGAVQQVSALNTSDSGPELAGASCDHAPGSCDGSCGLAATHGPLPLNGALFEGFVFLLTASSERDRLSNRPLEEHEDLVQTGPYNKSYTESQLQSGGGIVLKDFNHQQCEAAYRSLLIADQHCRNRKYLLCVAGGVPCVSHLWVRDCCQENVLLNYRNYLLPAGAGPGGGVREWRPRSAPFKALRVLLVLEERAQFWSELVRLGGGTAQIRSPEDRTEFPAGSVDVAVLDPGLDPGLVSGLDMPLVSVDWIVQSVVCGETLDFSSSEFVLDSSSSSS